MMMKRKILTWKQSLQLTLQSSHDESSLLGGGGKVCTLLSCCVERGGGERKEEKVFKLWEQMFKLFGTFFESRLCLVTHET